MMKKLLTGLLLLTLTAAVHAQLRSVGEVPADLKMSVQELYESDLQRAEAYTGGKVKNKNAIKEASYHTGKMMAGGRIVYGDPISHMVGRIADTLLKDYPELRKQLRFYTVKSPEVNAFATGQGMIFVNAGLVAQVENEAQLAFILSHEIVHYYRNHTMEELVGKDGKKRRTRTTDSDMEELNNFLRKHNRSREMENEADSLGVAMFYLHSPYDKGVTEGVFDVLQYSALPFDDVPFDTTFFNTPYYQLNGCWLDTVADITSRDNYDDSRSTHPNILTRRRNNAVAFDGYYGGEEYVMTTREEFDRLRHQARLECIRQELIYGEYSRALYNTWLLQREHPDDEQLNRYLAQSLYGVAMSKMKNGTNSVAGDYQKIEGESQQVYYAMRRMSNEQATLAALHTIWQIHRRFPANEVYGAMCDELMEEMRTTLKMSNLDFLATPPTAEDKKDTVKQEEKGLTKYERIKQKRQTQAQRSPSAYALTDLMMNDPDFHSRLKSHLMGPDKKEAAKDSVAAKDTSAIIVYSPSYWVVDDKSDELDVARSSRKEHDLAERIAAAGRRLGRASVDFSDEGMRAMVSSDQYNDFVVLNEWLNEFWQTKGQFSQRRLVQPEMDDVMERYGATTVSVTAVLNSEGHSPSMTPGYMVLLPLAPVVLYNCFANIERTAMVTLVVDAREGKVLSRQAYSFDVADHDALVDAMIYDAYARIGNEKKNPVGFLGHRFSITGGANLGLAGVQPFAIGKVFAFTPWANVEFAVDRQWTINAGWSYHPGYDQLNSKTVMEDIFDSYGYYHGMQEVTHTNLDYSRNMTTWSVMARKYDNTEFAPLGSYFGFGAQLVHFTKMSDGSNGGNAFGLTIGAGRNYIFFDRLLLNIEARYAYTAGGFIDMIHGFADRDGKGYLADAMLANVLLLKVGIGVIPF